MRRYQLIPSHAVQTLLITSVSPLPSGEIGAPYSFTFNAIGGVAPYSWSEVGAIPSGLTFSGGTLSGTPTGTFSSSFNVTVTDSVGSQFTRAFSLTVITAVQITTASPLPGGTVGVAYSTTIAATGGATPYSWSILGFTGANSYSINSVTGMLTGTLGVAEIDSINIQVVDALGIPSAKNFNLTVIPAASLTITTSSPLPAATQSSAYSTTMAATGGTPPYTWSLTSHTGSNTWSVSSAGVVTGVPGTIETDSLVIKVTDSVLATASGTFSLTVSAPVSGFYPAGHWVAANQTLQLIYPLTDGVTSANARHHWAYYDGTDAIQYQIPIVAMGGSYPYVFTLDSGSTALGMSIGTGWGSTNYGVLTWQPTGVVTGHTVTVTITDQQLNSVQAVFTISTSSATAHFVFLDASAGSDSSGSGTFSAPWQTLQKAFGGVYQTTGAGVGAICYLKPTATYPTSGVKYTDSTDINPSPWFEMNTTTKCVALIGLGSQAALDWTSGVFALALGNNAQDFFDANLNPIGFSASVPNAKFVTIVGGGQVRYTSFNNTWTNSGYGGSGTDVAGPYTAPDLGGSSFRSNLAIIGFTETNRQSGQPGNNYCGHTFYSSELWVSDGFTINMPSSSFDAVCYAKGTNQNAEMRNHFINVANAGVGGACTTPGFQPVGEPASTSIEVRYCYIGANATQTNQKIGTQTGTYGTFYMNRNTLIGQFENAFGGIGNYVNNVVQTSGTAIPPTGGGANSGNVTATSGIINSTTLLLQGSALGSVGTAGAQIA